MNLVLNSCACDCSAVLFTGTICEVAIPCDGKDITCQNTGVTTGTKAANNCGCDCSALIKY